MNNPETANAWIIYRLLPNFQRLPVAQFRSRSEAESSLTVIRQMLPNTELILAFEVGLENPTTELNQPPAKEPNLQTSVNRELLKLFIISSRPVVSRVIHSFHRDNFACVSDWSPLVPTQNPGEVMSVLIKHFAADS
ncbi:MULTISPECIES: hypothetical protein [unclassified Microcoleus]|uniref:hypothetical protein n=1 Tax=unclassified Microcoleus TaxID=2642155 RepID=UPI002FD29940